MVVFLSIYFMRHRFTARYIVRDRHTTDPEKYREMVKTHVSEGYTYMTLSVVSPGTAPVGFRTTLSERDVRCSRPFVEP